MQTGSRRGRWNGLTKLATPFIFKIVYVRLTSGRRAHFHRANDNRRLEIDWDGNGTEKPLSVIRYQFIKNEMRLIQLSFGSTIGRRRSERNHLVGTLNNVN